MNGRINGLDPTRCSFSSAFLCTQQLSPPLTQHCQSLAVTHLCCAVWLSCLSSSRSDQSIEQGWPGDPGKMRGSFREAMKIGSRCLLRRAAWLWSLSAKKRMSSPSLTPSVSAPRPKSSFISDVQELRAALQSGRLFLLFCFLCFLKMVYLYSPPPPIKRKGGRKYALARKINM